MASPSEHSTPELLRRFLVGEIGPREEAELGRRAKDDEGLRESMAGLRAFPEENHTARLGRMRRQLPRRRYLSTVQTMSIAAGILLLVAAVVFWLPTTETHFESTQSAPMASSEVPKTEKTVAAPIATEDKVAEVAGATAGEEKSARQRTDVARRDKDLPPAKPQAKARNDESRIVAAPTVEAEAVTPIPTPTPASVAPPALEEIAASTPEADLANDDTAAAAVAKKEDERTSLQPAASAGAEYFSNRSATQRKVISGYITDENDQPVSRAKITLPGQPIGEYSDSTGYFELVTDKTVKAFRVGHPDYEAADLQLPRGEHEVMISLSKVDRGEAAAANDWMLNGATTTIYPNEDKVMVMPVGGMQNLRQNINEQKPPGLPSGKVKLAFSVQPDGALTDFDIAKKSEAVLVPYVRNFLQQNSQWVLKGGTTPARISLTFRFD